MRNLGVSPREWLFFFYGRNLPGSAAGFNACYWSNEVTDGHKINKYQEFGVFRRVLRTLGFNTIYLPYSSCRMRRESMKLDFIDSLALRCLYREKLSTPAPEGSLRTLTYKNVSTLRKLAKDNRWDSSHESKADDIAALLRDDGSSDLWEERVPRGQRDPAKFLYSQQVQLESHWKNARKGVRDADISFGGIASEAIEETLQGQSVVPQGSNKEPRGSSRYEKELSRYVDECESVACGYATRDYANNKYHYEIDIILSVLHEWLTHGRLIGQSAEAGSVSQSVLECNTWGNRIQFLYAASLFRQPRHISAFYTHAAFPCPFRFNSLGIDNDSVRGQLARYWIEQLSEYEVFLRKQGGYCWKYRDVRLGIRNFLEKISPLVLEKSKNSGRMRSLDSAAQFRSHTHHWIGMWYERAFMATGNPSPLVESIYHRLEAIRAIPFAKPPSVVHGSKEYPDYTRESQATGLDYRTTCFLYRLDIASASLAHLTKSLLLGEASVRAWRPASERDYVFSKSTKEYLFEGDDGTGSLLKSPLWALEALSKSIESTSLAFGKTFWRKHKSHEKEAGVARLCRLPMLGELISDFMLAYENFRRAGFKSVSQIERRGLEVGLGLRKSDFDLGYSLFVTPRMSERAREACRALPCPSDRGWRDWLRALDADEENEYRKAYESRNAKNNPGKKTPRSVDEAFTSLGLGHGSLLGYLDRFEDSVLVHHCIEELKELKPQELEMLRNGDLSPLGIVSTSLQKKVLEDSRFKSSLSSASAAGDVVTTPRLKEMSSIEIGKALFTHHDGQQHADGQRWPKARSTNQQALAQSIFGTGELAYQYMLRARIEEQAARLTSDPSELGSRLAGSQLSVFPYCHYRWVQVSHLCRSGIDMCRHLRAGRIEFETSQLVKLHTLYGLSLAKLGRHFEANRHFNDATARLSHSPRGLDDIELAIIRLRRAEAFLSQASQIYRLLCSVRQCVSGEKATSDKKLADTMRGIQSVWALYDEAKGKSPKMELSPPFGVELEHLEEALSGSSGRAAEEGMLRLEASLNNLGVACLDDSTVMLDSAENLLIGNSATTLWWLNHHALGIQSYSIAMKLVLGMPEHAEAALPAFLADRRDPLGLVRRYYDRSVSLSGDDTYRTLRVMDHVLNAVESVEDCVAANRHRTAYLGDSLWKSEVVKQVREDVNSLACDKRYKLLNKLMDGINDKLKVLEDSKSSQEEDPQEDPKKKAPKKKAPKKKAPKKKTPKKKTPTSN